MCRRGTKDVTLQRQVAGAIFGPCLCQIPSDLFEEAKHVTKELLLSRTVFELLLENAYEMGDAELPDPLVLTARISSFASVRPPKAKLSPFSSNTKEEPTESVPVFRRSLSSPRILSWSSSTSDERSEKSVISSGKLKLFKAAAEMAISPPAHLRSISFCENDSPNLKPRKPANSSSTMHIVRHRINQVESISPEQSVTRRRSSSIAAGLKNEIPNLTVAEEEGEEEEEEEEDGQENGKDDSFRGVSRAFSMPVVPKKRRDSVVEIISMYYNGDQYYHKFQIESGWTTLRCMLLFQNYLESRGVEFDPANDVSVFARGTLEEIPLDVVLMKLKYREFDMKQIRQEEPGSPLGTSLKARKVSLGETRAPRSSSSFSLSVRSKSRGDERDPLMFPPSSPSTTSPPNSPPNSPPKETRCWNEIRVFVLGDSMVRSHVSQLLMNKRNAELHAMVEYEWFYKQAIIMQMEMDHFEVMDLFVTTKSLFFVVIDCLKHNDMDEAIRGWARIISSATQYVYPHAPAICVLLNANSSHQPLKQVFRGQFRDILLNDVDATSVLDDVLKLPNLLPSVSLNYLAVRATLTEMAQKSPVISFQTFRQAAAQAGVHSYHEVCSTLNFFSERGVCLYFPFHALLNNYVILDRMWLFEHLDALKNYCQGFPRGIVSLKHMEVLWEHLWGEKMLQQVAIRALAELGLVYVTVPPSSADMVVEALVIPDGVAHESDSEEDLECSLSLARIFRFPFFGKRQFNKLVSTFYAREDVYVIKLTWDTLRFSLQGVSCVLRCTFEGGGAEGATLVIGIVKGSVQMENATKKTINLAVRRVETLLSTNKKIPCPSRYVVCPRCISNTDVEVDSLNRFALDSIFEASSEGKSIVCKDCEHVYEEPLNMLAPEYSFPGMQRLDVELQAEIGRGAFGVVHDAMLKNGKTRRVAVKRMMNGEDQFGDDVMTSFFSMYHEMSMWKTLSGGCAYIVQLLGITNGVFPKAVMEMCELGDLGSLLYKGTGFLSSLLKKRAALDVSLALAYTHSCGIVHRDVRSFNVFMVSFDADARSPVAKLGDFGLATAVMGNLSDALPTFQWNPPEVLKGCNYDLSADVYSYGMFLYELVYQKIPFSEYEKFFTQNGDAMLWREMEVREAIEQGLRPDISKENTLSNDKQTALFNVIMTDCWSEPAKRPSCAAIAHKLSKKTLWAANLSIPSLVHMSSFSGADKEGSKNNGASMLVSNGRVIHNVRGRIDCAVMGPDSLLWICSGNVVTAVQVSDSTPCRVMHRFKLSKPACSMLYISALNKLIIGNLLGEMKTYSVSPSKMQPNRVQKKAGEHSSAITQLACWVPNKLLFSADNSGILCVWKFDGKIFQFIRSLKYGASINSLCIHSGFYDEGSFERRLIVGTSLGAYAVKMSMFSLAVSTWTPGEKMLMRMSKKIVVAAETIYSVSADEEMSISAFNFDSNGALTSPRRENLDFVNGVTSIAFPIGSKGILAVGTASGSIFIVCPGVRKSVMRQANLNDPIVSIEPIIGNAFISLSLSGIIQSWQVQNI